jgi:hypothetical protein
MKQISVFHKGIVTDLDYSKMDNQGLVLPTSNIRLLNIEGKGLVVTQVKGDKELFELTSGFKVIGGCEYNGIAYIASYNDTTNEGEIGCFPSPGPNGFENIYRPLTNTKTGFPLRSTQFNFSLENPIGDEMHALIDYDGTVNLTMTDGVTPLKMVNSGFNQTGEPKPLRYYDLNNLANEIQQIRNLPGNQKIEFIQELSDGQIKFGNYFFFYRYLDGSNNTTEFVAESKAFTVTRNSSQNRELKVSGMNESSGKRIVLKVSNLDQTFAYVQFSFMRFYSDTNGSILPEIMLVDNFYGITSVEMNIEITGFETFIPFDISEILRKVSNENVVKSIQPQYRRLWGAKWKGLYVNYKALEYAALKIKIGCNTLKKIRRWELRDFYANPSNIEYAGYFRNEAYITGVVFVFNNGYETERFPTRGADLRNFTPGNNINQFYSENASLTNNNGIVVMPSNANAPVFNNDETGMIEASILGLEFILDEFNDWISSATLSDNTLEGRNWFKQNVREIRFVRAERVPNMLYQGLLSNVYGSGRNIRGYSTKNASIPIINPNINNLDFINYKTNQFTYLPITAGDQDSYQHNGYLAIEKTEQEKKIKVLFSTDFIFGNKHKVSDSTSNAYLCNNYELKYNKLDGHEYPNLIRNSTDLLYSHNVRMDRPFVFRVANDLFKLGDINTVYQENSFVFPESKKRLNVVNAVYDKADDSINNLADKNSESNRSIVVPPVIAFEIDSDVNAISQIFDKTEKTPIGNMTVGGFPVSVLQNIVSIFKNDPQTFDYLSVYLNELNLNYFSISHSINLSSINENYVVYSGDCFAQLTTLKTRSWLPTKRKQIYGNKVEISADINKLINGERQNIVSANRDWNYAHGQVVSIISENATNTALRFNVQGQTDFQENYKNITVGPVGATFNLWGYFWPLFPFSSEPTYGNNNGTYSMSLSSGIESYLVNPGNSKTLSLKAYLSHNPQIPKGDNKFNNRIRYSGIQESNYPPLGYRIWNYNHKEDYDHTDGSIVKLIFAFNRLMSIQETSILLHHINREEVIPSSSGELVIGTRSILSKEPTSIAKFGAQHQFAIKRAKSGVYGWDWVNNVIWRVVMADEGMVIARSIGKENLIEGYLNELKERVDGVDTMGSSISQKLRDSFFSKAQEGIMVAHDKKNSEVLFCFSKGNINEIMRFNEDQNVFIGHYFFKPSMFLNLKSDTISFPENSITSQSKGYLFGVGNHCHFFGQYHKSVISFIVNGYLGDKENLVNIDKMFVAMEIESPSIEFIEKVEFQTLFQYAKNDPFHSEEEFWRSPEYLMSKWAFPINTATSGESQFSNNSHLQGRWLKVTITLKEEAGIDNLLFIKNIITKFITSNA